MLTITGTGNTTVTLNLTRNHGLNKIKSLSITNGGAGYNNAAGVTTTIYAADLVTSTGGTGEGGVIRANVSTGNTIESSFRIVEPGGAYGIGDTMTVSADPAGAPSAFAVLTVDDIYNNIGDSLELSGFPTPKLNGVFKIIDIPDANTVVVENDLNLESSSYKTRNDDRKPVVTYAGKGLIFDSLDFNPDAGIAGNG